MLFLEYVKNFYVYKSIWQKNVRLNNNLISTLFLSYLKRDKPKKSIVALLEYCRMVGLRVHEPLFMPSLPFAVKKGWRSKVHRTEPSVKQMEDGAIHFQGAMVSLIELINFFIYVFKKCDRLSTFHQ